MSSWRPEGWDIADYPIEYCEHIIAITNAFEAGADAILIALEPLIRQIAPSSKLVDILYPKEVTNGN